MASIEGICGCLWHRQVDGLIGSRKRGKSLDWWLVLPRREKVRKFDSNAFSHRYWVSLVRQGRRKWMGGLVKIGCYGDTYLVKVRSRPEKRDGLLRLQHDLQEST